MKVCFLGASGHAKQAFRYLVTRQDVVLSGIAPFSAEEGMEKAFDPRIPYFTDAVRMMEEVRPDLVVVSPVFGRTAEAILLCASYGADVFSEKPVATTEEDLERVRRAVQESGIRFCAMHYLRYDPAFYCGAALCREGAIGEIRMMTAQKSYRYGKRPAWYRDRDLYGGTIPWVGIHAIDWIYHFSGKRFSTVTGGVVGRDPEMAAICYFSMEDGIVASMNLDYYRPSGAPTHGDDRIRCVGTKGVLEVSGGVVRWMDTEGAHEECPKGAPELLEEFLSGREPIPAEEIFYLTRVAIRAQRAAESGSIMEIGEE